MGDHKSNPWWVVPRPRPRAALKLVCFPYAGAGASIFRPWHSYLSEDVEVCGIQLPGRQNRILESPFTRVSDLLEELGPQILPLLDRPFAFFGHSMGSILGFEMARWLLRIRGLEPSCLFVSGRRAPQISDTDPALHIMSDTNFVAEIRRLNGTPKEILNDPEILKLILPTLRADAELCETYSYSVNTTLSCSIIAFCGREDHQETPDRMGGWCCQTTGEFSLHLMPSDHFFIHSNERQLLRCLQEELNIRCRTPRTGRSFFERNLGH
jgi:medium-chain acyl-[acyl-carrier-protein] hydrolase